MGVIRILIVEKSLTFRTRMVAAFSKDSEISFITCVAKIKDISTYYQNSDVVVVYEDNLSDDDVKFLLKCKIPVLVSSVGMGTIKAKNSGFYTITRPVENLDFEKYVAYLKLEIFRATQTVGAMGLAPAQAMSLECNGRYNIIAIGASTGGTEAIIKVVKDLPKNTPGIVIVQHMPASFTPLYAERLDKICNMSVKEAKNNDRIVAGQIILAAGEYHLSIKKDSMGYYVKSQKGEKVSGHCPSVDVLFDSVAELAKECAIGVILTGMGADGAQGITKMRKAGAYTIGQDKDSSVVYGMPMEAYKLGGIAKQLPLDKINEELISCIKR